MPPHKNSQPETFFALAQPSRAQSQLKSVVTCPKKPCRAVCAPRRRLLAVRHYTMDQAEKFYSRHCTRTILGTSQKYKTYKEQTSQTFEGM